jgi:hypothetical protein
MVDTSKIRTLKEKSKGRKPRPNLMPIIIAIIAISVVALLAITLPSIIDSMKQEKIMTIQSFEKTKSDAINQINVMFSKYPSDPMKAEFITKIKTAKTEEEINKIIEEANKYVKLKEYKESLKNQIKNIYGDYFVESPLAQKIIAEIDLAKSTDEAGNIYVNNIEKLKEDAKKYYIDKYKSEALDSRYVRVVIDDKEHLLTKDEFLKKLNNYDLATLKKLKVYKVSMCEATLPVLAEYAGKFPKPGDKIMVYELINVSKEGTVTLDKDKIKNEYMFWNITENISLTGVIAVPISEAIVKEVYVVLPTNSIGYSETKSSTVTLTQDDDTTSASKDINIQYQLTGVSNLLHTAVMGKIDYNKLKYKFSEYGYRLNKLEDETQLFDPNVIYLFVIEVPSDKTSEIVMLDYYNSAIVKIND